MHPTRNSAVLIFEGSSERVMPGVRRLRSSMEIMLKITPVLISLVALGVSIYNLWSTKRDLKKAAERQFLETSSNTCYQILNDLTKCLAQGGLSLPKFVDSEPLKHVFSHKSAALRFQAANWYVYFEGVLTALGDIGVAGEQVTLQMQKRNVTDIDPQIVFPMMQPAMVKAKNAVAKYLNAARSRLVSLR